MRILYKKYIEPELPGSLEKQKIQFKHLKKGKKIFLVENSFPKSRLDMDKIEKLMNILWALERKCILNWNNLPEDV